MSVASWLPFKKTGSKQLGKLRHKQVDNLVGLLAAIDIVAKEDELWIFCAPSGLDDIE